ncbi:MAG: HypC/HybG/HupF family hydrogenase formation chaperone [Methanophagales archaeon ANME-1-THS]|nr:MAG: HypC/HybG/HupF family hydrogenase formation chaperone [Methanophagales archaeon ANME-1-THS]
MCLGIPAKVVEINHEGRKGKADFGGVSREVDLSLVDVKVGDYVIIHAGFAIELLDEEEAKESLALWQELLERCSDTGTRD